MDRRGCRKPGQNRPQLGSPFVYGSPLLQGADQILYECPVGRVLRETPHVYDIFDMLGYAESTSITEFQALPPYAQQALRLGRSEQTRLHEEEQAQQRAKHDSQRGMRAARA